MSKRTEYFRTWFSGKFRHSGVFSKLFLTSGLPKHRLKLRSQCIFCVIALDHTNRTLGRYICFDPQNPKLDFVLRRFGVLKTLKGFSFWTTVYRFPPLNLWSLCLSRISAKFSQPPSFTDIFTAHQNQPVQRNSQMFLKGICQKWPARFFKIK